MGRMKENLLFRDETGRSMLEILAVLGIMGILSVGIIYAYNNIVGKVSARDLMNQLLREAVVVSTRMKLSSRTSFYISPLLTAEKIPNTAQFKIKLSDVEADVCAQLKEQIGENSVIRAINHDCSEVVFNNNLSFVTLCSSKIVKVFDCKTKELKDCCPDNGNICEQPTNCACTTNSDCPKHQTCNNGICECPEAADLGAILGADGQTCCTAEGYAWNDKELGYYSSNPEACGCPQGYNDETGEYESAELIDGICCSNGYAWEIVNEGEGYNGANPDVCGGCPKGYNDETGEYESVEPINGSCCYKGYAWDSNLKGYYIANPKTCGCPKDGNPVGDICCWMGWPWNNELGDYDVSMADIDTCGCPIVMEYDSETGEYEPVESGNLLGDGVCCSIFSGLAWDGVSYARLNLSVCGCPRGFNYEKNAYETVEPTDDGVCCYHGYPWVEGPNDYGGEADIDACGCPYGFNDVENKYEPADLVGGICCYKGYAWDGDGYYNEDPLCP